MTVHFGSKDRPLSSWAVHFGSTDRPLLDRPSTFGQTVHLCATVHFRAIVHFRVTFHYKDGSLLPFWTVHFGPDSDKRAKNSVHVDFALEWTRTWNPKSTETKEAIFFIRNPVSFNRFRLISTRNFTLNGWIKNLNFRPHFEIIGNYRKLKKNYGHFIKRQK